MKALLVKEDGLIYAAEVPEEPKQKVSHNHDFAWRNKWGPTIEREWDEYEKVIASAKESAVLVSDQEKAIGILMLHVDHLIHKRPALKPGIYPIPDLKWEPRTVEKFYESKGWFWEKVAVISLPLESTPSTEQQPFNGCSPTACGCKSLADCPNNQPLAVATFVIQEDEKNGMYESEDKARIKELEALLKEIQEYDYQHLIKHNVSALTADLSDKIIKQLK